jgi:hypothetical protein
LEQNYSNYLTPKKKESRDFPETPTSAEKQGRMFMMDEEIEVAPKKVKKFILPEGMEEKKK